MSLINIVGDMGSGKTLLATKLATRSNYPVYANFKINIPNYNELTPEILLKLNEGSLIIIDEAYIWLESRTSHKESNMFFTYIMFQSRKRHMDIILTDQMASSIDVRFRTMANYVVQCENLGNGFNYRIIKVSRYKQPFVTDVFLSWKEAEKIFPLYDTLNLINPINDSMVMSVASNKDEWINEIDDYANELITKANGKRITKAITNAFCLSKGKPKRFSEHLYERIQLKSLDINK